MVAQGDRAGRLRLQRPSNENHETSFMIGRIRAALPCGRMRAVKHRSILMKWETPQATDFRFGMEITMYIAKR